MKIYPTSDLHLEFARRDIILPDADVLVLAGDIMVGSKVWVDWESKTLRNFEHFMDIVDTKNYDKIIAIAGNHEWYDTHLNDTRLRKVWEDLGVTYLDNESATHKGVKFIGSTLWSDYNNHNPLSVETCRQYMNDFRQITINDGDAERLINPSDLMREHEYSKSCINEEFNKKHNGKTVVITHHAPSRQSICDYYKDPKHHHMNGGFCSSLEYSVPALGEADLWIHGHMHSASDYMVGNTRVYANPHGYGGSDKNADFSASVVEI